MKFFTFFLFLLLMPLAYCQDISIDIKKSKIFNENRKFIKLLFSENTQNDGLLNVREIYSQANLRYPKGYIIEHFNSKLELMNNTSLNLERREVIKGLKITNDIVELIVFRYDKLKRSITVKLLNSTLSSLKFTEKTIFTFNQLTYQKYFDEPIKNFLLNSKFQREDKRHLGELKFSKNKNFIVLSFEPTNKVKETHFFFVFDKNYELIYHKKFSLKKEDWNFSYKDLKIDDKNGNLFLLIKEHNNKTNEKTKIKYHYTLFDLNKKEERKLQINLGDHNINSLTILLNNNNISLLGFYGNKIFGFKFKGVCTFKIDLDKFDLLYQKFSPFSEQFIKDKYGDRKKETVKNIKFRSVFIDNKGNMVINAEESYITSSYAGPNGFNGVGNDIVHFDDIISVKLNNKGDLLWARNINKRQVGYSTASYTSVYTNDKVYFFINALDKFKKLSNERIGFKHTGAKNSNLYVISIAENGDISYKKLVDSKDSEVWYKVNNGIVSSESNSVTFQGWKNKKKQIIRLTIQ